ncbi:hypothetical protein [Xanthomonas campestris]|uniref:hypothetical protein n=1 Tax=Xanthomonas campestris TaxID=339 RepID=UPI0013C2D5A4|nr:hypothetical protein [Xanthomonas campestris]
MVGLFGECDRFACQLVGTEQAACASGGQLAQLLGFAAQARCMRPASALMAAVVGDQCTHVVGAVMRHRQHDPEAGSARTGSQAVAATLAAKAWRGPHEVGQLCEYGAGLAQTGVNTHAVDLLGVLAWSIVGSSIVPASGVQFHCTH